jgi:hypothetical protein
MEQISKRLLSWASVLEPATLAQAQRTALREAIEAAVPVPAGCHNTGIDPPGTAARIGELGGAGRGRAGRAGGRQLAVPAWHPRLG